MSSFFADGANFPAGLSDSMRELRASEVERWREMRDGVRAQKAPSALDRFRERLNLMLRRG